MLSRNLKGGGRLTICHSQGREAINNLHRISHPAVAKDYLPDLDVVKELAIGTGLEPYISVDSNSMYLVSVRKPVTGENAPAEPSWDCCL